MLMRDRSSQQFVYETRAVFVSRWTSEALLPALFEAALKDFPHASAQPAQRHDRAAQELRVTGARGARRHPATSCRRSASQPLSLRRSASRCSGEVALCSCAAASQL